MRMNNFTIYIAILLSILINVGGVLAWEYECEIVTTCNSVDILFISHDIGDVSRIVWEKDGVVVAAGNATTHYMFTGLEESTMYTFSWYVCDFSDVCTSYGDIILKTYSCSEVIPTVETTAIPTDTIPPVVPTDTGVPEITVSPTETIVRPTATITKSETKATVVITTTVAAKSSVDENSSTEDPGWSTTDSTGYAIIFGLLGFAMIIAGIVMMFAVWRDIYKDPRVLIAGIVSFVMGALIVITMFGVVPYIGSIIERLAT